ncbi:carbohydrate ABC transporter permease [Allofournierella sp.]|uniref:carbohydrate ABC transporter permease n=2 Tax=Allofournierella sp. TaxID=1940256 RepID=UPI00208046C5|nr:ABC transporter permease [Oscillospiraceae bacterium]
MSIKAKRGFWLGVREVLFIALTFVMMLPIYYLVITTFKTPYDATNHPLALPAEWHFEGYLKAWQSMDYPHVFKNTLVITVLALGGMLILAAMASYVLARRKSRFNTVMFFVLLSGMMVPFQMSIMTQYKLVRALGLMNNILSVVLIDIAVNLPMAILFMKNFISASVPVEIEEAAYIDGCSVWGAFFRVTVPLLRPVIATLAVMNSIAIWNDFLTPLMFLQSKNSHTILLAVNSNVGRFSTNWTDMFPMMVLGVMPLVIFFLLMQKHIIKGLAVGSVKG